VIRLIDGLPDNVVGLEGVGEVSASDYTDVMDPAVDAALAKHDKIRLVYVLGDEFTGYSGGAMWQDTKVGMSHFTSFEKIAMVTDHSAYRNGVKAFGWLIPGEVREYPLAEREAAIAWVTS
jgi:hypothetical protein